MRTYYVHGWHGNLNAGDDAFAIVTNWGLKKYCQSESMVLEGDLSGILCKEYRIQTIQNPNIYIPGLSRLRRLYFLSRSKHFILAGGSLFNEKSVDSILNTPYLRSHKPVALGVSVGPFYSDSHEKKVVRLINQMQYVGFRDDYSYDWAKSRNISIPFSQAFDLAPLIPFVFEKKEETVSKNKKLGIALLAFNFLHEKVYESDFKYISDFAKITYQIAKEHCMDIELYALCTHPNYNDKIVCKAFLDAIPDAKNITIYEHDGNAYNTFEALNSCTHFISMRLHGGIFAYTHQLPLFLLSYHQKCRDFAKTIGLNEYLYNDLSDFDFNSYRSALSCFLETHTIDVKLSLQSAQDRALENFRSYEIWQ